MTPADDTTGTSQPTGAARRRPRIEGDREAEVLNATLKVLAETGYQRFSFDAVAAEARVSKTTLYRHWESKADLVTRALQEVDLDIDTPDRGSLKADLASVLSDGDGLPGLGGQLSVAGILAGVAHDPQFARGFREIFVRGPALNDIWDRAIGRGEARPDLDRHLTEAALFGTLFHLAVVFGTPPGPDLVDRVTSGVVLPMVLHR